MFKPTNNNSLPTKPRILVRSSSRSSSKENHLNFQSPKASQFIYKQPQSSLVLKQNNEFLNNFHSPPPSKIFSKTSFQTVQKENKPIKAFPSTSIQNEEINEPISTQNSIHENYCKPFDLAPVTLKESNAPQNSNIEFLRGHDSVVFKKKPIPTGNDHRSSSCSLQVKLVDLEAEKSNKKVETLLDSIKKETEKQKRSIAQISFFKMESPTKPPLNPAKQSEIFYRENHFKANFSSHNPEKESKSEIPRVMKKENNLPDKNESYYRNFVFSDEKKESPEVDVLKYAVKVETPQKEVKPFQNIVKPTLNLNPFLAINSQKKTNLIHNNIKNEEKNCQPVSHVRAMSSNTTIKNQNIEALVEDCLKKTRIALSSLEHTLHNVTNAKETDTEKTPLSLPSAKTPTFMPKSNENKKSTKIPEQISKEIQDIKPKTKIDSMFYSALNRSQYTISKHFSQKISKNDNFDNNVLYRYIGDYVNDQKHGFGLLTTQNGEKIYIGDWKFNKFNGQGVLYNQTKFSCSFGAIDFNKIELHLLPWKMYEGEFQDGQFHGNGSVSFENGERINCRFVKGKLDGEGTFYHHDGEIIVGVWQEGILKKRII